MRISNSVLGTADSNVGPSLLTSTAISFRHDVQPILERRCVLCHGCYDAPCQLKLTAWEGVARGATSNLVYDGARLLAASPTRLFEDADRASAWRLGRVRCVGLAWGSPSPASSASVPVLSAAIPANAGIHFDLAAICNRGEQPRKQNGSQHSLG